MRDLIESGDLDLRKVINCENINIYHDKLIKKYKQIKIDLQKSGTNKLITDNGTITQIINYQKLFKAITFWFGTKE